MSSLRAGVIYALVASSLIAVSAVVLGMAFQSDAEQRAIGVAALVAFTVQMVGFAIARSLGREQMMLGWGLGSLLRMITLAVFGFVIARALGLPPNAALISLATFFFVSMIIEPLLLAK